MTTLRPYRVSDIEGLTAVWNTCFAGSPNFIRLHAADLRWRVLEQPAFNRAGIIVASRGAQIVGFVHSGPRLDWQGDWEWGPQSRQEAHIYALVAPESDRSLMADLLGAAQDHLVSGGAHRLLLGPSWVYGVQPFYNGVAGAYELPGFSATRESALATASALGYRECAEYGTPEMDLSGPDPLRHLAGIAQAMRTNARDWGLHLTTRPVQVRFFPKRTSVELLRGREAVATAAFGEWPEYARQYRRRLHGITSVQVSPEWRGRGLGKLVVIEAMEAARKVGADGVHLHVWKGNEAAWNLYHRALCFQPTYRWITLEKKIA